MDDRRMGDNGRQKLGIGDLFEVGDLMMLIETLDFASARSLFSGSEDRKSVAARFQFLAGKLAEMSPLPKGKRNMGYDWFEVMKAAGACRHYLAYLVTEDDGYGGPTYHLEVVCDDVVRRVVTEGSKDEILSSIEKVMECLRDQAPIDAEPLVMLASLVEMERKITVRRKESIQWHNEGRLDEATAAIRERLKDVSSFVHVVEATNSWAVDTMLEARFAVPLSACDRVIGYIDEMNAPAKQEYEKRYSKREFSVTRSP
jgi:hypothetical protein